MVRDLRHRAAWSFLGLLAALPSGGCIGHLMGWRDAEVDRLRKIVAELEAKNAVLLERNLDLRERIAEIQAAPDAGSKSRDGAPGGSASGDDAPSRGGIPGAGRLEEARPGGDQACRN